MALALAAVLGAPACSNGGSSASAAEYTKAVQAVLVKPAGTALTAAEARCAAPKYVAVITPDGFRRARVTPAEVAAADRLSDLDLKLSDAQADAIVTAAYSCVDLGEVVVRSLGRDVGARVARAGRACLTRTLEHDAAVRSSFRADIVRATGDNTAAQRAIVVAFGLCRLELYTARDYVDASMSSFSPSNSLHLTRTQAQCVVTAEVATIGVARLETQGVTPSPASSGADLQRVVRSLAGSDVQSLAVRFGRCFNVRAVLARLLREQLAAQHVPPAVTSCVAGKAAGAPDAPVAFTRAFLGDTTALVTLGERLAKACRAT